MCAALDTRRQAVREPRRFVASQHGEDFEALHRVIPPTSLTSDHRGSFAFDHEQWVADVLSAADDPRPTI